jgi:dethiobiotin synthetase
MSPHPSRLTPRGFFVTGTNTGVGKTLMACALLHAFANTGKRVIGMKPVAAGATRGADGRINDDVTLLRAAGNINAAPELINPYSFERAIAPHLAAELEGVTIDLATIVAAFEQLAASANLVIVEGVGGFCVPLNNSEDSADLAVRLDLPIILVVGMRLG